MFGTCWLAPFEQDRMCGTLLQGGILKWDNNRQLPLAKGGFTDVYINLRECRSNPQILGAVARAYQIALMRLGAESYIEVPQAVSGLAGAISLLSSLPYATIRETPKQGRVSDANVIGRIDPSLTTAIIDDVITDGRSKLAAYRECKSRGVWPAALVVLVDRQQGWHRLFEQEQVFLPVWGGMTLHDVRSYLIKAGAMEQWNAARAAANPLVVALDDLTWEQMLLIVDELRPFGLTFKIGDAVDEEGLATIMPKLSVYGRVVVDLKPHDIPNTVANRVKRMVKYTPRAVTIHASGGPEMVKAASRQCEGTQTKVLAVTVLTSHDSYQCEQIFGRTSEEQVLHLAQMALEAGAHGIVCSPHELPRVKARFPGVFTMIPGVRSAGEHNDDQARVATPSQVIADGADLIVMGREILRAPDRVMKVQQLLGSDLAIPEFVEKAT